MDEPDGLIDIFSVNMQGRPELTLNGQCEITKAMFNPHNPNIVIASTMAGYLLEWDIRAKKEPISGQALSEKIDPSQSKRAAWQRTVTSTPSTACQ